MMWDVLQPEMHSTRISQCAEKSVQERSRYNCVRLKASLEFSFNKSLRHQLQVPSKKACTVDGDFSIYFDNKLRVPKPAK